MKFHRRKNQELLSKFERVSREIFGNSQDDSIYSHLLSRMYFEDWHRGVIPFVYGDTSKFNVEVSPSNATEHAMNLFSSSRDRYDSNEAVVSSFLSENTQLLILDGCAIFEVAELSKPQSSYTLKSVAVENLNFINGKVVQTVPENPSQGERTVELPLERVIRIDSPPWIESGQGFEFIVSNLIKESKRDSTPINHYEKTAQGLTSYFDYSEFRKMRETRILKLTRQSGWQGRTMYSANLTEHYFVIRFLRFVYNCFRLRDFLIGQYNTVVFPQLKNLGFPVDSITIKGLPSPENILKLQEKVEKGEIGFKEAMERCALY